MMEQAKEEMENWKGGQVGSGMGKEGTLLDFPSIHDKYYNEKLQKKKNHVRLHIYMYKI